MTKEDLPEFDSCDEPDSSQHHLTDGNTSTETIDLSSLFTHDVYSSGSFDLSSVGSTALGKLLDALPVPAVLIDQYYRIAFVNRSTVKLSPECDKMRGLPFTRFLSCPNDPERARLLADKTIGLFERLFTTRKPQTAETILEISGTRIWARIHLRAVRIGLDRHLLALIEDLTPEKRQIELGRRQEHSFQQMRRDLVARIDSRNEDLLRTGQRFKREVEEHLRTRKALRAEEQKFKLISELSHLATALVAPTGTFQQIDSRFRDMFGFELTEVPNFGNWILRMGADISPFDRMIEDALEAPNEPGENRMSPVQCTVLCRDGRNMDIRINGIRIADDNYFIACEEIGTH